MLKTQIMAILLVVLLLILAACAPVPEAETPPISPPNELQTYTLTITISPSETGAVFPSSGQYVPGLQVTLTATPASGYTFDYWDGDTSGSSPAITITMDSDKIVIAHFKTEQIIPPAEPEPTLTPQVTTEWITPISAEASSYTVWGETWYTGPPELAIDGNDITAWTLNDMGKITFDLGSKRLVTGIEAYWGGHVTNGNTVNVFVDNTQVLHNERFGATSNEIYFNPIQGRYIKYQTVPLPHNEFLQVATWSEIAEFRVLVESE